MRSTEPHLAVTRQLAFLCAVLAVVPWLRAQDVPAWGWDRPAPADGPHLDASGTFIRDELIVGLPAEVGVERLQEWLADVTGASVTGWIPACSAARVQVDDEPQRDALRPSLLDLPWVRYVDLNGVAAPGSVPDSRDGPCDAATSPPSDPLFGLQWQLNNHGQGGGTPGADIDVLGAWALGGDATGVVIAVIDVGFILQNTQLTGSFVAGYDFLHEDDDPSSTFVHGTEVSGLIAAAHDDGEGVSGVAPNVSLMPLMVGSDLFDFAQAFVFASEHQVSAVSMSMIAFGSVPQAVKDAMIATSDAGIPVVLCGGNSGGTTMSKFANVKSMIAIGWTNAGDLPSPLSSHGPKLDFVAPGVETWTVDPHDGSSAVSFSGCSAATPITAGIVAMLLHADPGLGVDGVYELLRLGAEDQVGPDFWDTHGFDEYYGWGRVNAYRSLSILLDHGLIEGGLSADTESVDPTQDWQLDLCLDAGAGRGGHVYWLFANLSGAGVANDLGFATIPLASDPLLRIALDHPNSGLLGQNLGLLDGDGRGSVTIAVPAGAAVAGSGLDLSMCYVTLDPQHMADGATYTSEVVAVAIE